MKSIQNRLILVIVLVIGCAGSFAIFVINGHLKKHAIEEARATAMVILDRNLAIHHYFSQQLKPSLFADYPTARHKDHFEPRWMSSTYAVREIERSYQARSGTRYSYKECAINARSPANEADDVESAFIRQLNKDPSLQEFADVREIDGELHYMVLRRGESMEQDCLLCHSTPEIAPAELVDRYGPSRSFFRTEGEVVSALSLRIPLDQAYQEIDHLIVGLSLLFICLLLTSLGIVTLLNKRWIFDPLAVLRRKTIEIATSSKHLGEVVKEPEGTELTGLIQAFNIMSEKLGEERALLEERIAARTEELQRINDRLQEEVDERKLAIARLNESLQEIKKLQGILPICSYCRKVRDEQGAWSQLERYIEEHSEAAFSHGICHDCARKHFPDFTLDEG